MSATRDLCCWYSERRIKDPAEAVRRLSDAFGAQRYMYVSTMEPLRGGRPAFVPEFLPGKLFGWMVRSGSGTDWHDVPAARAVELCRKHRGLSMLPSFPDEVGSLIEPHDQYLLPEAVRGEFVGWLHGWRVGPNEIRSTDPFEDCVTKVSHFTVAFAGLGFPPNAIEWMRWWQRSESFRRIDEIVQSAVGPMKFAWNWFLGGERPADFPPQESAR